MQLYTRESKATLRRGSHDSFRAHEDTHSETVRYNKVRHNRTLQSECKMKWISRTLTKQFNESERQLLIASKQVYTDNIIRDDNHKFMRLT